MEGREREWGEMKRKEMDRRNEEDEKACKCEDGEEGRLSKQESEREGGREEGAERERERKREGKDKGKNNRRATL